MMNITRLFTNPSNSVFHFVSFAKAKNENQQNKKDKVDTEKPNICDLRDEKGELLLHKRIKKQLSLQWFFLFVSILFIYFLFVSPFPRLV